VLSGDAEIIMIIRASPQALLLNASTVVAAKPSGVPKVHPNSAPRCYTGYDQPPFMLLFVPYACLRLLIDLALAPLRDRAADQAELLVLRHQVRVLERQVKVVRWRQADRLVFAALARRLPRPSWHTLLVKPETVFRWHRGAAQEVAVPAGGSPAGVIPSTAP